MLAYSYLRFSDKEQGKGDSIRRQRDGRDRYIEKKGLQLDTSLTLADLGVSAFRGRNAEQGALGLFLEACNAGRVKRGSFLIVENLDRLSRQDPDKAIRLFLDILDYGITIVTLQPEKEFSKPVDMTSFILAVIELCRGNSESRVKSYRLKEVWLERRKGLANGEKITKKVPSWIIATDEVFQVDETKAEVIRRIFRLIRDGYGYQAVSKLLNTEKVKPISQSRFWHQSYMDKLLHNRSLLGEFQPRMLSEEGKRVEAGKVIKGYFPVVISPDLWREAHQALAARRTQRGRISKKVSNLFTDLAYMDDEKLCHRKRNFVGYLTTARQDAIPLRYDFFERALLLWLNEANIRLGENTDQEQLEHKRDDLAKRIKTLEGRMRTDPDLESLLDTLSDMKRELKETQKALALSVIPSQAHVIHGKQMITMLSTVSEDEKEPLRRQLKQTLRMLVSRIDIAVEGELWNAKTVSCVTTFRDGKKRAIYYRTRNGRLLEVGLALNIPGVSNMATLERFTENTQCGNIFTEVDTTAQDRIAKIKAMRGQGLQLGAIAKKLGVHRVTLYKWLKKE